MRLYSFVRRKIAPHFRDTRICRVLIAEANRWERAYREARDQVARQGQTIAELRDGCYAEGVRAKEAERRMHLILDTIYTTHGYLDADGEIDTAAKFRAIERLARLDWDAQGMSHVV